MPLTHYPTPVDTGEKQKNVHIAEFYSFIFDYSLASTFHQKRTHDEMQYELKSSNFSF